MTRSVLITGANKGIGYETARRLAERGYRVWLGARDRGRGEGAAAALRAVGHDVHFLQLQVDDVNSVIAAAERVGREDGKLDALVNNAAVPGAFVEPEEQEVQDVRQVLEVNVLAPIHIIQTFLPLLKEGSKPSIVNVSSELGSLGTLTDPGSEFYGVNALGYNVSKTALNGVTVAFAKALESHGIRVNSADPGYTDTDFNGHSGYRTVAQAAEIIVELVDPEEGEGPTAGFFNHNGRLPW